MTIAHPAGTAAGDEDEARVRGVLWLGADADRFPHGLDGRAPEFGPAWSADGKNLLFLAVNPPTNFLGIWDFASGSAHFIGLPATLGLILDPAWSR